MFTRRRNRSRSHWGWRGEDPDHKILEDEKLVGFRMSAQRYAKLKERARKQGKSVAQLINDVLDRNLKLGSPGEKDLRL